MYYFTCLRVGHRVNRRTRSLARHLSFSSQFLFGLNFLSVCSCPSNKLFPDSSFCTSVPKPLFVLELEQRIALRQYPCSHAAKLLRLLRLSSGRKGP
jgi:hypothetical protein